MLQATPVTIVNTVVTGMKTPTATTCRTHRWSHRGRRRGHTSKKAKAVVADRPRMMVRASCAILAICMGVPDQYQRLLGSFHTSQYCTCVPTWRATAVTNSFQC